MRQRVSSWAWCAVVTGATALVGCGRATKQADDAAPFDAVVSDDSAGSVYGLRASGSSLVTLCSGCLVRAWSPDRTRVLIDAEGELQVLTAGATASSLALDLSEAPNGGIPASWQLQSAWSADGSWLSYVWNGAQAFIADGDGQNPIELVTNETPRTMPIVTPWDSSVAIAWAPTDDHVALRFPSGSVYIGTAGSSDTIALDGSWDAATWSPDGALLALTGPHGAELVDATGGNRRALESSAVADAIGWSSDGSRFAYVIAGIFVPGGPNTPAEVRLAAADGSATLSAGPGQLAAWAPSSTLLALGRALDKDAAAPARLSVWSPEAGSDQATQSLSFDLRVGAIAWSSSGERLLYRAVGGAPDSYWAVIDPVDGSELQRFTGYVFPVWDPAGSALATLTAVTGTLGWKLELQPEAASATLLGDGVSGPDGWAWLAAPGHVAFGNADGIFIADLRGNRTRLAGSNASQVRFFRTTPGVSDCPRASRDCSGL